MMLDREIPSAVGPGCAESPSRAHEIRAQFCPGHITHKLKPPSLGKEALWHLPPLLFTSITSPRPEQLSDRYGSPPIQET